MANRTRDGGVEERTERQRLLLYKGRCARESTEFASGSKIVGENRGEMENSIVTQDSTHRGFCLTFPL